ncbi:hypothetical protein DER46DRAFT_570926 [Fusarium sp. MPI-SDFR-AT-0072]|nr:hypothetical protein DER46DRAFT_570926 [Fusarium sp. MPI-SDFR-AT-0072]
MELPRSWWIRQSRTRAKKRRRGAWTSVGRAPGPEPRGRLSLSWTGSVAVRYQYLTVCLLSLSLNRGQNEENPEALEEISHCTALEMASSRCMRHSQLTTCFSSTSAVCFTDVQPSVACVGQGCTAHQWGRQDVEPQTEVKRRENLRQSIGDKGDTLARRDKNKRHIHISTTLSLAESPRRVGERKNERRPNEVERDISTNLVWTKRTL